MKHRTVIGLFLALALVLALFSGCASESGGASAPPSASAAAGTAAQTRTVTDMTGRTVEIPGVVNTIVPLGNTPRMITYLGLADRAVGIGGMDAEAITPVTAYAYANRDLWKDLPVVGTDAGGATDYYPEQIIAAAPDVVLCSYNAELADEIQSKTGIPTVAVAMGTLFGDDYDEALRLLGQVCGAEDRAEAVISYIDESLADLAARTADVPDADKPTVLGAAATFKGAHGIDGVYTHYAVFEAIAANDVTDGITETSGGVMVDKEQILGWDPQYIFLDSGGVQLVKQDVSANPDFYALLQAVTDGNVYQYPSSTSYYSNVEIPLVNAYYVGGLLYPDRFADVDFETKANEIFKFFLDTDDYLGVINGAGAGYGKADLGAA